MDAPTVLLHDETGRSLLCYLERSLTLNTQTYGLLQPVDAPIVIFSWQDDEEDEEPVLVDDEKELKHLFPTAKAVLSEQNLTLLETAITLTVEGDLPEVEEEDESDLNGDMNGFEAEESEEFQLLAIFYHEEREYGIYTPLEPFLIVTRMEDETPKLISPEEFAEIEPLLEEILAQEMGEDLDSEADN